jgi:hypothetical protein
MNRLLLLALPTAALAQTYYGCYVEGTSSRALTGAVTYDYDNMTVAECTAYCTGLSYPLWGIEYSGECYCGDALTAGAVQTFPSQCDIPCPGNPSDTCGGNGDLSLYGTSPDPPSTTDAPHAPVTASVFLGCYTEGNGTRALAGASVADYTEMTVEDCSTFCLGRGFLLYGLEYAGECYCGSALDPSSITASPSSCNMPCAGDQTETCGGSNRLSVYQWQ